MEPIALRTLLDCTVLLEQHRIPYAVGGSVASSIYGEERSTRDVDILAQLDRKQAQRIFPQLESAFYIQYQDVVEAITRAPTLRDDPIHRATFNMVHRETLYKIDLFVSSGRPFEVSQLRRTIRQVVSLDGAAAQVTSAEDTILAKLEWFEMSNRQLDRQWSDITMMFNIQQSLDLRYLRTWAEQLGVGGLLEKAIAGESPYSPPDSSQRSMF